METTPEIKLIHTALGAGHEIEEAAAGLSIDDIFAGEPLLSSLHGSLARIYAKGMIDKIHGLVPGKAGDLSSSQGCGFVAENDDRYTLAGYSRWSEDATSSRPTDFLFVGVKNQIDPVLLPYKDSIYKGYAAFGIFRFEGGEGYEYVKARGDLEAQRWSEILNSIKVGVSGDVLDWETALFTDRNPIVTTCNGEMTFSTMTQSVFHPYAFLETVRARNPQRQTIDMDFTDPSDFSASTRELKRLIRCVNDLKAKAAINAIGRDREGPSPTAGNAPRMR